MQRLTTPFGFQSEAEEVLRGVDLTSKRIVVTGGASGIGLETVRALAGAGAEVTLAVRRPSAAETVIEKMRQDTRNPRSRCVSLI